MKITDLTTPEMMRSDVHTESDIMASLFEKELKKQIKGLRHYRLTISGEYSREAHHRIENSYKSIGWVNVRCETSGTKGYSTLTITSTYANILKPVE